jgi:hypothetical protein
MSREIGFSGISLQSTILRLGKETTWSGFLDICQHLGFHVSCIILARHTSQNHARLPAQLLQIWKSNPLAIFYPTFAQKATILRAN